MWKSKENMVKIHNIWTKSKSLFYEGFWLKIKYFSNGAKFKIKKFLTINGFSYFSHEI